MREYNALQAIFMSFYSRGLYRDVANHWGAGVFFYLFFLLAICWGIMMFSFQPAINVAAHAFAEKYVMQIPDVIVKDGQIITPQDRPYLITDPNTKTKVNVVIDPSGKFKTLQESPQDAQILVTKNTIFYYDNDGKTLKSQVIPTILNLHFDPVTAKRFLEESAKWAWMIIFPVFLFFSFIYRLVQVLIYGVLGKLFAAMLNVHLSYVKIVKLCMVAITPAIIIGDILNWCGLIFHFQWLLLFLISMLYLIFALKANGKKQI